MSFRTPQGGFRFPAGLFAPVLLVALAGCDQGKTPEALSVTPEHVELSRNNETARFSVSGGLRDLSLPLEWEVADPAIGNIIAREGVEAEYARFNPGVNIVLVRDRYGSEGFATVTSPGTEGSGTGYSLILAANPDTTIPAGVNTVTIKVINGVAPFSWSVSDPSKGSVSGGSGDTVTYTASVAPAPGDPPVSNTVICRDKNGARGTLEIVKL